MWIWYCNRPIFRTFTDATVVCNVQPRLEISSQQLHRDLPLVCLCTNVAENTLLARIKEIWPQCCAPSTLLCVIADQQKNCFVKKKPISRMNTLALRFIRLMENYAHFSWSTISYCTISTELVSAGITRTLLIRLKSNRLPQNKIGPDYS